MTIHANISEINKKQWQQLVDNSPVASFFQTPECYDFYASLSFLEPFVFGISENEKLVGLICGYVIADGGKVKRFFSRRAIISGGALLDKNISEEALQILLKSTINFLKNKAIYIELRNYNDYSKSKIDFEKVGFCYNPHLNFHVSISDVDSAFSKLNAAKRRAVRLSQKEGTELFEITEMADLKVFYEILVNLYKKQIKLPLFPFEFFEKLKNLSIGRIFGVKYDGRIVGGSVCIFLNKNTVYQWFECGLDDEYKNIFPSTMANWAVIAYAAENGFSRFDMMGAGKPD